MQGALRCLEKHGQRLGLKIAEELRVPLTTVRQRLSGLSAKGSVILFSLTRDKGEKTAEALQRRVSGYVPSRGPGRKPKAAS